MSAPHDVLAQLLSAEQADALDPVGTRTWAAAARVLGGVLGAVPGLEAVDARLVMPDEVTNEYASPHLVAPLEVTTDKEQSALAYLVVETAAAAVALGSEADDPNDQEQQTIVMASTVLGQVVSTLNAQVFADSGSGLVVSMDDMAANTMPTLLAAMDEPALALDATLTLATPLPVKLFLPGTFLDIVAGAMTAAPAGAAAQAFEASADDSPFTLTEEDLDLAKLVEDEAVPEPVFAVAGAGGGGSAARGAGSREPTPIGNTPAAQRAHFAPLAEPAPSAGRSAIDLLSGLQMNVTVELGRTELTVSDVLGLGPGSVVELDRLAGEPVDILVNDRLIARGEVVVVDENFGVRVVEVVRRGAEADEQTR